MKKVGFIGLGIMGSGMAKQAATFRLLPSWVR